MESGNDLNGQGVVDNSSNLPNSNSLPTTTTGEVSNNPNSASAIALNGTANTPDNTDAYLESQAPNVVASAKIISENIPEKAKNPMILVVLLLILLAMVVAFACLVVIPAYLERTDPTVVDERPTAPQTGKNNYPISSISINNGLVLTTIGDYVINKDFTLTLKNNGVNNDVIVNGHVITSTLSVLPNVGLVSDVMLFVTQENTLRTTKFFAVTTSGEKIYEFSNIDEGFALLPDSSSVVYNNVSIVLLTSRIFGSNLILSNSFGTTQGYNICDSAALLEQNVDGRLPVMANYSIMYEGNHQFSTPLMIGNTTLDEYKKVNNLCN